MLKPQSGDHKVTTDCCDVTSLRTQLIRVPRRPPDDRVLSTEALRHSSPTPVERESERRLSDKISSRQADVVVHRSCCPSLRRLIACPTNRPITTDQRQIRAERVT